MIMSDRTYYDFLDKIDYEGAKNVNGQGFVARNQVPFLGAGDAVTFIMLDFPAYTPADRPIVQDHGLCRELADTIHPEVEQLCNCLERTLETARKRLEEMVAQRDAKDDRDLLESVQKQVLQEQIMTQIGVCQGLSMAWNMLHTRKFELWQCSRLKGAKRNVETT